MKRVHYASGSLLTGDTIADELVRYAAALAAAGESARVCIPVLLETGKRGGAILLLGPASQILAEHEQFDCPELIDEEFGADVAARIRAIGPRRAGPAQHGTEDLGDIDLGYL